MGSFFIKKFINNSKLVSTFIIVLIIVFLVKVGFSAKFLGKLGWSQVYTIKNNNKSVLKIDQNNSGDQVLKLSSDELLKINSQQELLDYWQSRFDSLQGKYGWYVLPLEINTGFGINYQKSFTAASVNKVPIMLKYLIEVERKKLSLNDIYFLKSEDIEDGTGSMQYQKIGTKYSFQDIFLKTGIESDNTGVNVLANAVSRKSIQPWLDNLGFKDIVIKDNMASPKSLSKLFQLVYRDKLFKKQNSKQLFYQALTNTQFENRIPAGIPKEIKVVHKIGNQVQTINDCGIVFAKYPYAICILSDGIMEKEAKTVLPQISQTVYSYLMK